MKVRLSRWQLCAWMGICALIVWPLGRSGRIGLALPILNGIGLAGLVVAVKGSFRRFVWYWMTMAVIVGVHVSLILMIPWTTKWIPAPVVTGVATLDFFVILVILAAVEIAVVDRTATQG
jgi:uncharacterized membrane protein (DUF485 family)